MKPELQHNLTDAEFIRLHEYSDDPLLRQACARLDALIDKVHHVDTVNELKELRKELG